MKIKYIIIGIIVIIVVLFTNIVSQSSTGIIIQMPNLNYFVEFVNTDFFMEISFLMFLFILPYVILSSKTKGKRGKR